MVAPLNPYVAGNPVTGDLFVGREDILCRLEELWRSTGPKPSVVIYGHRRMGKSSILHNLGARFGARTVIVDFNMQRVGLVASTGELLYNLALALYDAREETRFFPKNLVSEPDEERFTAHNPYTAFDRFLKRLDRTRAERRFIVTVDEFELIEAMIAEAMAQSGYGSNISNIDVTLSNGQIGVAFTLTISQKVGQRTVDVSGTAMIIFNASIDANGDLVLSVASATVSVASGQEISIPPEMLTVLNTALSEAITGASSSAETEVTLTELTISGGTMTSRDM